MTLLRLFGVLFAVNLLTVGGGYVMLPLLHGFFVDQFRWLTEREFLDAVAVGQVTPGPLTLMNAFIGFKVAGVLGAVVAALGSYLPSVGVVTAVARFYERLKGRPAVDAVFKGITAAVVGMLLVVVADLGHASLAAPWALGICLVSLALTTLTRVDPTLVILGAGLAGALLG